MNIDAVVLVLLAIADIALIAYLRSRHGQRVRAERMMTSLPTRSAPGARRAQAGGGAAAFVSMGNTGAALAAGLLHVHRIKGVLRPALCTLLPAVPTPVVFL